MPPLERFWDELFASEKCDPLTWRVTVQVLRRHGRPFLLLPNSFAAAKATLQLYPAQTRKARAAKALLTLALATPLRFGLERTVLRLPTQEPFVQFVTEIAGRSKASSPTLGVLAGNPRSPGQRFVILVFAGDHKPLSVVKAGLTRDARHLVVKERGFLHAAGGRRGIPRLQGTFANSRVEALAMDFYEGEPPRHWEAGAVQTLLQGWLWPGETTAVDQLPAWGALRQSAGGSEVLARVARRLQGKPVVPCIQHGDFAPWNIKVSGTEGWRVFDWERGELRGIPGWDWFHYVLQTSILVEHRPTAFLVRRTEEFLQSVEFAKYARAAAFDGRARELLLAYLLHLVEVIRPSEGLEQNRRLLSALAELWRPIASEG